MDSAVYLTGTYGATGGGGETLTLPYLSGYGLLHAYFGEEESLLCKINCPVAY